MDLNLFGKYRKAARPERRTERGDMFDSLLARLNPPRIKKVLQPLDHKRLAYVLTAIPTRDLYALLSKMDDAERRGIPAGAIFWTEIKPKNQPL